jgi:hypothetical protein
MAIARETSLSWLPLPAARARLHREPRPPGRAGLAATERIGPQAADPLRQAAGAADLRAEFVVAVEVEAARCGGKRNLKVDDFT